MENNQQNDSPVKDLTEDIEEEASSGVPPLHRNPSKDNETQDQPTQTQKTEQELENEFHVIPDDIEILQLPKHSFHKALQANVPVNEISKAIEPCIKESMHSFVGDYALVNHRNSHYDGRSVYRNRITISQLSELSYEVDHEDGSTTTLEQLAQTNEDNTNSSTLGGIRQTAQKDAALNLFDLLWVPEKIQPSDSRDHINVPVQPIVDKQSFEMKLRCLELKFGIGEIEPYFISWCIVDVAKKQRVSEMFHFDLNNDFTMSLMGRKQDEFNPVTRGSDCIFSVDKRNSNLHLLIYVHKILQADLSDVLDPYMKYNQIKPKDMVKVNEMIRMACNKLHKYRQCLAWGMIPLFNDFGDVNIPNSVVTNMDAFTTTLKVTSELVAAKNDVSLSSILDEDAKKGKLIPDSWISVELRVASSALGNTNDGPSVPIPAHPTATIGRSKRRTTTAAPSSNTPSPKNFPENKLNTMPVLRVNSNLVVMSPTRKTISQNASSVVTLQTTNTTDLVNHYTSDSVIDIDKLKSVSDGSVPGSTTSIGLLDDGKTVRVERLVEDFTAPDITDVTPNSSYCNNLYIYPENLNLGSLSARNIAIQASLLDKDDDVNNIINNINSVALPCVYSRFSDHVFDHSYTSPVVYHEKQPSFYDEIKLKLPNNLNSKHHILFTFYHISCKIQKKQKNPKEKLETVAGYAILPVYPQGHILEDKELGLPVTTNLIPHYLNPLAELKWVDSKKPLFNIKIRVVSSIYTQDPYLNTFFKQYQSRLENMPMDENIALESATKVSCQDTIRYFNVIMNMLLQTFTLDTQSSTAQNAGAVLVVEPDYKKVLMTVFNVLKNVHSVTKDPTAINEFVAENRIFRYYMAYAYQEPSLADYRPTIINHRIKTVPSESKEASEKKPEKRVFEELTKIWMVNLKTSAALREMFQSDVEKSTNDDEYWQFASFFFGIIIKSMTLCSKYNPKFHPTNDNKDSEDAYFRPEFVEHVTDVLSELGRTVVRLIGAGRNKEANILNRDIALFIKDLFFFFSPNKVFPLIQKHLSILGENIPAFQERRLAVLAILCDYEHYIPLNWGPKDSTSKDETHFFLSDLWLYELSLVLRSPSLPPNDPAQSVRFQCIYLFRNLIRKHDLDARYQPRSLKEKIASMYFPLLGLVLNNHTKFSEFEKLEMNAWLVVILFMVKNTNTTVFRDAIKNSTVSQQLAFFNILNWLLTHFEYPGMKEMALRIQNYESVSKVNSMQTKQYIEALYNKLQDESKHGAKRDKDKTSTTPNSGSGTQTPTSSTPSLPTITISGGESSSDISAQETPDNTGSMSPPMKARGGSTSGRRPVALKKLFGVNVDHLSLSNSSNGNWAPDITIQEAYFGHVTTLTVLRLVEDFIEDFQADLSSEESKFLTEVVKVFVTLLKKHQSLHVLIECFRILSNFVQTFKTPLFCFKHTSNLSLEISFEVLRHCNFSNLVVRDNARKLLYHMFKMNFEAAHNFSRMKLNVAINISTLVSSGTSPTPSASPAANSGPSATTAIATHTSVTASASMTSTDFDNLKNSLDALISFSSQEQDQDSAFAKQLQPVMTRLYSVLRDSVKISQFKADPEMTADLFYQISNSYLDSPDLRLTWLKQICSHYMMLMHWEESAQAMILVSWLVFQYMVRLNIETAPEVCEKTFKRLFPNLHQELPLDLSALDDDATVLSKDFTETGLISLLRQAAELLKKSELFEPCILVYNMIVGIYQRNRNYDKLSQSYQDLHSISKQLAAKQNARLWPAYYRVGFYGTKFGDLNGKEYIYKENRGVIIPEVVERFKSQFKQLFGSSFDLEVLPNTAESASGLDPKKCFIQIISVQPYFETLGEDRIAIFDQKHNIDEFIYETPFTEKGGGQTDSIAEQFKRKTILKTEMPFPYIKKRIRVQSKKEIVLKPIENAVEVIEQRCQALLTEINCYPPNTKTLQNILQGSVLAQVNAGPVHISKVFLDTEDGKYPKESIATLKETLSKFVILCGKAVDINGTLVKEDQKEFQVQLEQGYVDIKLKIMKAVNRGIESESIDLNVLRKNIGIIEGQRKGTDAIFAPQLDSGVIHLQPKEEKESFFGKFGTIRIPGTKSPKETPSIVPTPTKAPPKETSTKAPAKETPVKAAPKETPVKAAPKETPTKTPAKETPAQPVAQPVAQPAPASTSTPKKSLVSGIPTIRKKQEASPSVPEDTGIAATKLPSSSGSKIPSTKKTYSATMRPKASK